MMNVLVNVDNIPKFNLEISPTTSIFTIKDSLKQYVEGEHEVKMYINSTTELKVFDGNTYDAMTLQSVWGKLNSPKIFVTKSIKQQKFTGSKDTDFIIIDQLDDESLLYLCQTNKYLANICNDENFWEKRFKLKNDLYHIRIKPDNIGWKNYYMEVLGNKNNIYVNSRKNGRQLYIGESPVIPEDPLIYSHVEKPKRLSKVFYAIINKKGELLSELYTNSTEIKKFYKDNFLEEYGALGNNLLLTNINEKWVIENIYKK